jgi:hypothetical protein
MADTNVYAGAILTHQHGLPSDDYHRISSNPFWVELICSYTTRAHNQIACQPKNLKR